MKVRSEECPCRERVAGATPCHAVPKEPPGGEALGASELLYLLSPHSQGTVDHRDSRAEAAGANPGVTQLLDMPKPIQDGPSHITVLPLCLCSASTSQYDYEISGPLGRENYKEMYLFIYRTDVVSVVDTYQYEDPQDVFSREPFILRVSAPSTSKWGNKWPWIVAWGGRGADIPLPWQK